MIKIIIIIYIILLVAISIAIQNMYNNTLNGFWEADSSFCEEAGLNSMCFYINDNKCYLLFIDEDSNILINQDCDVGIKNPLFYIPTMKDYIINEMNFKNLNSNVIPKKITYKHYMNDGKLIFYNNDEIYSVMYKNNMLSDVNKIKTHNNKMVQDNQCETL